MSIAKFRNEGITEFPEALDRGFIMFIVLIFRIYPCLDKDRRIIQRGLIRMIMSRLVWKSVQQCMGHLSVEN